MTETMMPDKQVDVLVVGSGAAGLAAALTASVCGMRVLVCEKASHIGGTSATSGGTCWVPGNHHARARGIGDSIEAAARYLDREIGVPDSDGRRAAFLQSAGEAFEFVERHSALEFSLPPVYPDYHPAQEGAANGGRALQPLPFDGRRLGRDFERLRAPNRGLMILGGLMVSRPEAPLLARPFSSWAAFKFASRSMLRYAADRLRYRRGTRLLLGNALVASLYFTLRERGVEIWTDTAMVELMRDRSRVQGAAFMRDGRRIVIQASRATVLGTGGFTSNPELRRELGSRFPASWALSAPTATGDALHAARAIGAAIDLDHAAPSFFMPASIMTTRDGLRFPFPHVIADRARPGVVAINRAGKRFVNEADSYHDFVMAMYAQPQDGRGPAAFLVCDRRFLRSYGIGLIRPVWQWIKWYEDAHYIVSAPTLAKLAERVGVDARTFVATIERYNADAERGADSEFAKGGNALNRFNGDAGVKPNPCLAPIVKAPFFAVPVFPAAIGASIGLATDCDARVLDASGHAIDGLYACGNDQASIMRGMYPAAGITLGPAITFAYRAVTHAVRAAKEAARAAEREEVFASNI